MQNALCIEGSEAMPKLPRFKTEEQLAAFVDTNDTAPYWSEMLPVEADGLRVKRRHQTSVRVPVSQATLKRLRALSQRERIPLDSLLQQWVVERVKRQRMAA